MGNAGKTAGHLLFSIVTTAYILVAIHFLEEKDLEKCMGKKYKEYQQDVPMLIPFTKKKKQTFQSGVKNAVN